jgi:hypothetical protein
MTDTKDQGHMLPVTPQFTPVHIRNLMIFFGENNVTAQEVSALLDVGDLKRKLDDLRSVSQGPGLWSKRTHDRYLGVIRA